MSPGLPEEEREEVSESAAEEEEERIAEDAGEGVKVAGAGGRCAKRLVDGRRLS